MFLITYFQCFQPLSGKQNESSHFGTGPLPRSGTGSRIVFFRSGRHRATPFSAKYLQRNPRRFRHSGSGLRQPGTLGRPGSPVAQRHTDGQSTLCRFASKQRLGNLYRCSHPATHPKKTQSGFSAMGFLCPA